MKRTPQPQKVGFSDLVGTGIAPVSKKTAVRTLSVNVTMNNDDEKVFFRQKKKVGGDGRSS